MLFSSFVSTLIKFKLKNKSFKKNVFFCAEGCLLYTGKKISGKSQGTFLLELEPEPEQKKPGAEKNGPAQQHWP